MNKVKAWCVIDSGFNKINLDAVYYDKKVADYWAKSCNGFFKGKIKFHVIPVEITPIGITEITNEQRS